MKIISLYRCQDITKKEFVENLLILLKNNKNIKNHFLIGDFNINLMANDQTTREYKNDLYELGYITYFNGITRPNPQDSNLGTCIDNMFLKTELENRNSYKFISRITDHYSLMISIKTINGKKTLKSIIVFLIIIN